MRPLLRADEFWCQGFSEPGAGSDLASLSTRALREGETYRVTGQKVWTSMADRADWMFALVRTGPPGRSTNGITYLLIPMKSRGITVRPLRDISGVAHFAEVFLDDVEVPVENRVGNEGEGWSIMRTSLGHERATAFLADEFKYRRTADKVIELIASRGLDCEPLVRQDIARLESGVRTIAANSARALATVLRGDDPGGVASVNRLVKSEVEQHMHTLALRAAGPYAALGSRASIALDKGRWTFGYLMSRATTIGAGTAEIQRNTIAETVLGLPSHRGEGRRNPQWYPVTRWLSPTRTNAGCARCWPRRWKPGLTSRHCWTSTGRSTPLTRKSGRLSSSSGCRVWPSTNRWAARARGRGCCTPPSRKPPKRWSRHRWSPPSPPSMSRSRPVPRRWPRGSQRGRQPRSPFHWMIPAG
ncbi:acyl-CoA dehydrogenase, C-terminal domain protein [Mycobacterium xenopi 4042]|uniref:Acyl-CoA dehydrogenase, C-terminal domain protein n=1 Tax=Mycobacterium xenopi 4042 TaxID=1299334 RepID=X8AGC5_MYCXE|nr:acyl-CoA dehydrogenase, C-terminal domain protein [Mycobacterium xenopi 4042]